MNKYEIAMCWLCGVTVATVILALILQPHFEARTFNKFSKTKATYFDALVSELRVMPDRE
jgi:hypothetical protein